MARATRSAEMQRSCFQTLENERMKTITIMGLGLMGSSLGLALKKRNVPVDIRAYARRAETCEKALAIGAADSVFTDPVEAVRGADMVVLCVPILTIPELAKACLPGLSPEAVLTDVGSTKGELVKRMEELGVNFVGSHPICGSEQQGIEAADADLYEGAVTVVTSENEDVSNLWKSAGSTVRVMTPEVHDEVLAATSHLPHVVAAALTRCVDDGLFCGSGFRDTTRVAEGSPEVWSNIARTNAPALTAALKKFAEQLNEISALVEKGDGAELAEWFAQSRKQRRELLG